MRILVTGCSGFLGSAITHKLSQEGHEVIGIDVLPPIDFSGVWEFKRFDLSSPSLESDLTKDVGPCEAIVHAGACLSKDPLSKELSTVNCAGTHRLARLASQWGSRVFVYLSSVPVIGKPKKLPITEDHPLNPLTLYHASKLYGEYVIAHVPADFRKVILRITSPVGPGLKRRTIFTVFAENAANGSPLGVSGRGTRVQNYVDARDVASSVAKSLYSALARGVYNISGPKSISNLELAKTFIRLLNSSSTILTGITEDPEEGVIWEVSSAKAAQDFSFVPQFEISQSIEDYLRYEDLYNQ